MIIKLYESREFFGEITPDEHSAVLEKITAKLISDGYEKTLTVNPKTDSTFSLWSNNGEAISHLDDDIEMIIFDIFSDDIWGVAD